MRAASTLMFAVLVLVGCGGGGGTTDSGVSARPTCDEIMEQCHPFDVGLGEIHECHELSEAADTTEAACVAMRAHCFEVCVATDAGPTADSGSETDSGPASDSGHPDGSH